MFWKLDHFGKKLNTYECQINIMNWVKDNILYITKVGSQAYGISNKDSDLDIKGICLPPKEVYHNLFHKFEQVQNPDFIAKTYGHLNPHVESTIYSLQKFFILSAQVNPNMIELLWTNPNDWLFCHPNFNIVLENRKLFLSSKCKFTFGGYAIAQLKKIERHRKWINSKSEYPKREDFGLPSETIIKDEVFSYIKSKVEEMSLNQFKLDELDRFELKEKMWEVIYSISKNTISWDNWVEEYSHTAINNLGEQFSIGKEIIQLLHKEKKYNKALDDYKSRLRWETERNKSRKELEIKYKYDVKHGAHLIRLLKMGIEILNSGTVIVHRPDANELLDIRNGKWPYEKLIEYSNHLQKKLDDAYKTTSLPKTVNYTEINNLYQTFLN
jgi:predicted nucleotidyltransferase